MTPSKNLVVKAEVTPKIGEKVVNEKLKHVGTVSDIFGPVSKPYATVKPATDNPASLVDQSLYVVPAVKKFHGERRRRRD